MEIKDILHRVIDTQKEVIAKDCLSCGNKDPAVYTTTKIRIVFTDKSVVLLCQYHYLEFTRMRRDY